MASLPSSPQSIFRVSSRRSRPRQPICRAKSFPGRFDQLPRIRSFVREIAREAVLDSDRTFDLEVAVSEAAANAIEHGVPKGDVNLFAICADERLTFTVSHPGSFRPRIGNDPSRRNRGMGVPLMLALTDEMVVSHPPGNGTTVSLSLSLEGGRSHYRASP
jgi:anti-sigma regulatory factor (Ser/Thr protein kinase)